MRRLVFPIVLVLAGCASERVVLLPSADGRPGQVVVSSPQGEQRLTEPYAATVRHGEVVSSYRSSPEDVAERFGQALAAQPQRAASFVVYFAEGGDVLTAESQTQLAQVKAALEARPAAEVLVVGHTDRVGSVEANDALSLKRAEAVREVLLASGLPAKAVTIAGRGEREPAVPTDDEVAEAKNRRVEITVR